MAGALGAGVASSPLAHADVKHLRHQQAQAQHSAQHAQADLDESSHQATQAYLALTQSRAEFRAARHDLRVAHAHVQAAKDRLHQIQRQLERAKVRLSKAVADQARGQRAVTSQHDHLVDTVTSLYEEGDPELIGFLSLLSSATPAD